jgi:DNA uptake protein ComE-like DNA-binding protein
MPVGKNRFFYWNKRERRGSIVLLSMLTILLFAYGYLRQMPDKSWEPDREFLAMAQQFADSSKKDDAEGIQVGNNSSFFKNRDRKEYPTITGFFNPNGLSENEWVSMGLSAAQAKSVKNFEAKGGRFYRKEDLKKLFVISESFYAHIEPHVQIPSDFKSKEKEPSDVTQSYGEMRVDINQADSASLDALPGISPKLAGRMIRFRQLFGGFVSVSQVKDMPGFFADSYETLTKKARAGSVSIKPLNLNYCTFKELLLLPGMNYERVKAILTHRERNGFFRKTEDLVTLNLAEPELYLKIAPYIEVK